MDQASIVDKFASQHVSILRHCRLRFVFYNLNTLKKGLRFEQTTEGPNAIWELVYKLTSKEYPAIYISGETER